jgi:hypothetical protein
VKTEMDKSTQLQTAKENVKVVDPHLPESMPHDEHENALSFIGRLGTYRYLDMHVVIGESLDLAKICLSNDPKSERWPVYSNKPL